MNYQGSISAPFLHENGADYVGIYRFDAFSWCLIGFKRVLLPGLCNCELGF